MSSKIFSGKVSAKVGNVGGSKSPFGVGPNLVKEGNFLWNQILIF